MLEFARFADESGMTQEKNGADPVISFIHVAVTARFCGLVM
jgi:hypothetical protein